MTSHDNQTSEVPPGTPAAPAPLAAGPPPASPGEGSGPLVEALFAARGLATGSVLQEIDPRDEMLAFLVEAQHDDRDRALYTYFRSGLEIAETTLHVLRWRFGDLGRVGKLLDFASGYGRVTRFLVRNLPAERIWVADVYADGVRFQRERLGVHDLVSTVRPEDFSCAERFDAILVSSLFTHLPEERFLGWLRVLAGLLKPGGVLVWSVHGEALLDAGVELPESGILFHELSESGSLATHDYGSTWVSEQFVRRTLARAAGPAFSLLRIPRGLCNFQDLYVAVPEAGAGFDGLRFRHEPVLHLERCEIVPGGRLELSGWVESRGDGCAREVRATLDGRPLGTFPIELERGDVVAETREPRLLHSGWRGACALPPGASRTASQLCLIVIDDRGAAYPVHASAIESATLDCARRDGAMLQRLLVQARGETERERENAARARLEAAALAARIAAMEKSRFWNLRTRWFQVKRWLGWTEES